MLIEYNIVDQMMLMTQDKKPQIYQNPEVLVFLP